MKKLFCILLLILLIITGCSATPSSVSKRKAKKLASKITYVRDSRTELCYAVVSSRVYMFGIFPSAQKGLGLTQVPCADCRDELVN